MIRKLLCFLGFHRWHYWLSEYNAVHLDGTWPKCTRCEICGKKYHKENSK